MTKWRSDTYLDETQVGTSLRAGGLRITCRELICAVKSPSTYTSTKTGNSDSNRDASSDTSITFENVISSVGVPELMYLGVDTIWQSVGRRVRLKRYDAWRSSIEIGAIWRTNWTWARLSRIHRTSSLLTDNRRQYEETSCFFTNCFLMKTDCRYVMSIMSADCSASYRSISVRAYSQKGRTWTNLTWGCPTGSIPRDRVSVTHIGAMRQHVCQCNRFIKYMLQSHC